MLEITWRKKNQSKTATRAGIDEENLFRKKKGENHNDRGVRSGSRGLIVGSERRGFTIITY